MPSATGRDNYYTINGSNAGTSNAYYRAGMYPIGGASHQEKLTGYGNAVWAGVTGDIVAFDPFRVAFDFNYGSVSYDDSSANRAGWLLSAGGIQDGLGDPRHLRLVRFRR